MRCRKLVMFAVVVAAAGAAARAQMPTYHLGRAPSEEEIRALDLTSGPAGKELTPGKGTAREGAPIFAKKCVACHGRDGEGSKIAPRVVKLEPMHPFATTIWSFINGAMPRKVSEPGDRDGTLTSDEVYALTAWILFKNGIIQEDDVLDAKTLPRVHMPTRDPHVERLAPRSEASKK